MQIAVPDKDPFDSMASMARVNALSAPPFGSAEYMEKGRPMFESHGHPYQYDKSYQFRQAEARRASKDIFSRRGLSTSGDPPKSEDLSLTSLFCQGQTEVLIPHEHMALSRCASAPSQLSHRGSAIAGSRLAPRLGDPRPSSRSARVRPGSTPGRSGAHWGSMPVWQTHGMCTEAHIPGYFGHIPGYRTMSSTVGCRFSSGTQALRDLSRGNQVPVEPPPPFEGGSPRSRTFSGSFSDCSPWIGTLRCLPPAGAGGTTRRAPSERGTQMPIPA